MTLNSFEISNEPIREAACADVPELMVIAGPNGVGKSTLMETLFRNLERGRSGGVADFDEGITPVYFSPHRAPVPGTINELFLTDIPNQSYRDVLSESGYNVGSRSAPGSIRGGNWGRSRSQPDAAPHFEVKKRLAQLYKQRTELLTDVYDELDRVPEGHLPDIYQPFREAIRSVLPGIKFVGIDKDDHSNQYEVQFENRGGDVVEFDDLSSGEKDVIALIFLLVEEQIEQTISEVLGREIDFENLVMLIDGPESYLHPQLQLNFLEYARDFVADQELDREVQVLMCTHSQMILEHAHPAELYLLVYPDQREGNQLVNVGDLEMDLFRSITGELGTAALSTGNPILLVEGKSDREILRHLYPGIEDNLSIVPMGGKQGVLSLNHAFNRLIPELVPAGIEPYALIDNDRGEVDNQDVSDRIHILPVTTIENWLLDSHSLYAALDMLEGDQLRQSGFTGEQGVADLIEEIINRDEFFRHEVITRLHERLTVNASLRELSEINANTVISELDEAVDVRKDRLRRTVPEVKESVESSIKAGDLDDLDGKYILGEVGSEFSIQRDHLVPTTAGKMESLERQPEWLNEIIDSIA